LAQVSLARRLTRSGAIDLIVGHHVHVVQPIRSMHQRWVAYGVGNSLTGMTSADYVANVQDGLVLLATFELGVAGWQIERVRFAPTWVQPGPYVVRLVGPALDGGRLPGTIMRQLRASWNRTVGSVDAAALEVRPFRRSRL
jgi:poly-gamma-glutamate synthesis protein (capsule biosynthesis protein)